MIDRRKFLASLARWLATFAMMPTLLASNRAAATPAIPDGEPLGLFTAALAAELGAFQAIESDRLKLEAPQIAEDGAVVPITLETDLLSVTELVVLVEKNPRPLAARFKFHGGAIPFVSTRLKMNETCDVVALAKTPSGIYSTRRTVKVLAGGCG